MVVKVNVSMPQDLLQEVDKAAQEAGTSRSAFLADAVRHYVEEREAAKTMELREKAAAGIDRFRKKYGGWDATAEVLKWRQLH